MLDRKLINAEFEAIKDIIYMNVASVIIPPKSVQKAYNNFTKDWIKIENFVIRQKDISLCLKKEKPGSKKSILYYKNLKFKNNLSLNLIFLETGRKHQIRATFSSLSQPILGDKKYGSNLNFISNGIALHSYSLLFKHPVKDEFLQFFNYNTNFSFYIDNSIQEILQEEISNFLLKFKEIEI